MAIVRLRTVDAFIAFDFDDCAVSAGGTRLAPDVTEREAELLARAMTYKFAVLGVPTGGAKGAIRHAGADREGVLRRYCEEIRPLVEARRFLTGPDLGTSEADFAPLREGTPGVMASDVDGVSFEDVVTGYGVVVAAEGALGSLERRTFGIEGFGKVGGGVAREAAKRGARVVALSTIEGSIHDPLGLDVEELLRLRTRAGDAFIRETGLPVHDPAALFDVECDVLVPGTRVGMVDAAIAGRTSARAVVPAANVPYTAGAVSVLNERGIPALADFICNAGAVIGYLSSRTDPRAVLEEAGERITALIGASLDHPSGPYAGGCALAEDYLRTWRSGSLPAGPPVA